MSDNKWSLVYDEFDPDQQGLREAICTLGNGYFATRAAVPEADADEVNYPGTYLAGGYNRLETEISGRLIENEDLVNFPNWLVLKFRIDDQEWFDLRDVDILSFCQTLDLKAGTLIRQVRFRDDQQRTTKLVERRFVHLSQPHLAGLEVVLSAEDWSGTVAFLSAIDGRVENTGVERYQKLAGHHHEPVEMVQVDEERVYLKVRTVQSGVEVANCQHTRVYHRNQKLAPQRELVHDEAGLIGQQFEVELNEGSDVAVEKIVSLFTNKDPAISECGLAARDELAGVERFEELLERHALAWELLWRRFDIAMDVEDSVTSAYEPALILRLHVFHLVQTASPNTKDLDVGVPARGWHGEAYRGHIFWDELFIFPLLNLRMPEITRSLLNYRYRRLDAARDEANKAGYDGAMFPWQSGSSGREESQVLHLNPESGRWLRDNTHLQYHVSADIAYNVWQYFQVTDDLEYLLFYGAEIILEVARFFASLTTYNERLDRYEICGVMGPDEYHDSYPGPDDAGPDDAGPDDARPDDARKTEPGLDNNAYTNVMAVWVLTRALDVLDRLPELRFDELHDLLELEQEEIDRWRDISQKMRICFHDNNVISQFEGYEDLEEFDWEGYREKYDNIQRLDRILEAEDDTPNKYKASKQADVLMLFYLFSDEDLSDLFEQLGYEFDATAKQRNIDYYLKRTSHGSTLSRVVHSWVTADCDRTQSWNLFLDALKSDVSDIQGGTTPEGIHLGAMAGTVDLVQRSYAGIEIRGDDVLRFNPQLPNELSRLHLDIRWRAHSLAVTITSDRLKIATRQSSASPIRIGVSGEIYELEAGQEREFSLERH
jgi:alpha,alpha-trehalase